MSMQTETIHRKGSCLITLLHDPVDPLSWIVEKRRMTMFGARLKLSRWFNLEEQARRFAQKLAAGCEDS